MSLLRFVTVAGVALGLSLAPMVAYAAHPANTHTTHNLNLRTGPGMGYPVQAVVPAGAAIDINSCGVEWCHVYWGAAAGYVAGRYLATSVTVQVTPLARFVVVH
jgi:uncharacterized protein YraI